VTCASESLASQLQSRKGVLFASFVSALANHGSLGAPSTPEEGVDGRLLRTERSGLGNGTKLGHRFLAPGGGRTRRSCASDGSSDLPCSNKERARQGVGAVQVRPVCGLKTPSRLSSGRRPLVVRPAYRQGLSKSQRISAIGASLTASAEDPEARFWFGAAPST